MATRNLRPVRVEGNIAYVPLTQGHEAIIDAADTPHVGQFNWSVMKTSVGKLYARRTYGQSGIVLLHRQLMCPPTGVWVDHIDGNTLDNRRANLRLASPSQNCANARKRSDNTSGFKGVTFDQRKGKWQAMIWADKAQKFLGYHDTPEQAHAAYVAASAILHGDFSNSGT